MNLLELPTEVLLQIMDHLLPSFREDIRCLTISKRWFFCAQDRFFRELKVNSQIARRLLSSSNARQKLGRLRRNLRTIVLELKGFDQWTRAQPGYGYPYCPHLPIPGVYPTFGYYTWCGYPYCPRLSIHGCIYYITRPFLVSQPKWHMPCMDLSELRAWKNNLDNDLRVLAALVQQSPKLHTLRVQALVDHHPEWPWAPVDYLSFQAMKALMVRPTLRVLDLDLSGALGRRTYHICHHIGTHVPNLKRLRLRLRFICSGVFGPVPFKTLLSLSEVVINLSCHESSTSGMIAYHTAHCSKGGSLGKLKRHIRDQLNDLRASMASPKIIRVLSHGLTSRGIEIHSLDVLTGKYMRLNDGMSWEDDGEIVEKEWVNLTEFGAVRQVPIIVP